MISINAIVCLAGLVLWAIFTKWNKIADGWAAEVGRIMFWVGLLAWLLTIGPKVAI